VEDDPLLEFKTQVEAWQTAAAANGLAARLPGLVRREWVRPAGLDPELHVSDPENVKTAISRESLNESYRVAYLTGGLPNAGRIGEIMAFKTAVDYLGSAERALQARYAGKVRCASWASARRRGHGDTESLAGFSAALEHCRRILDGATVNDNAPPTEDGGTSG